MSHPIIINGNAVTPQTAQPTTRPARHALYDLAEIEISFTARASEHISLIESWNTAMAVEVLDPYTERTYDATFRVSQVSYSDNNPNRRYTAVIKEIDRPPHVSALSINGLEVPVLKYSEHDTSQHIIRTALIKLTPTQFQTIRESIENASQPVIRRIDVDVEPIHYRYGGAQYWSEHTFGEEIYYKQIINFMPPDTPVPTYVPASWNEVRGTISLVKAVTVRVETLVTILLNRKIIDQGEADTLLGHDWKSLAESTRLIDISSSIYQVSDAEAQIA